MCRTGYCEICGRYSTRLSKHHKLKKYLWNGKGGVIWCCREPCHNEIEKEITRRENALLKQHPEIYLEVLDDFLTDKLPRR